MSRSRAKTPRPKQALRFNAPPTWPTPPAGWTPDPGWQPDPSWGPVPAGWHLWVDARAVAGWPPPDATPSPKQIVVSLVIAGTLGLGVLVAYGIGAGEPELHDPVAVLVNNGGTGIDVAMTSCRSFDVTDVQLIAVANANGNNPGPEQVVWDFRPTNPKQRVFHLAAGGPAGSSYPTLASIPAADSLFIGVYYVQSSAPKGFTDRIRLNKGFDLTPSDSDRQRYDRAVSLKC